jgi:hypothetical protein
MNGVKQGVFLTWDVFDLKDTSDSMLCEELYIRAQHVPARSQAKPIRFCHSVRDKTSFNSSIQGQFHHPKLTS